MISYDLAVLPERVDVAVHKDGDNIRLSVGDGWGEEEYVSPEVAREIAKALLWAADTTERIQAGDWSWYWSERLTK